jgi:alcohol dehydrogenase class IV
VSAANDQDFTFVDGERLVRFGATALADAPALLPARGFDGYALMTTERALASAPELGEGAAIVLHVPPGPVPEAAAAVRGEVGGRPLVALGGGRVIDAAKAIAGADGIGCAAIPTTLSGAEMTPFHRMPAGVDEWKLVRPSLVIADPALMASQPLPSLAASTMNALAHAVEALYAPMANAFTEVIAVRAAELLVEGLAPESPDRPQLALGALMAGYAVGITGFAIHHAVCQTIVRTLGTPHAETNAVMLPHFVRMMEERVPAVMSEVESAEGVAALSARCGVTRLGELGVREEQLDEVVAASQQHPALANTPPAPPSAAELRAVLEAAL